MWVSNKYLECTFPRWYLNHIFRNSPYIYNSTCKDNLILKRTWDAKEKFGLVTPFLREMSAAAAEDPFLFLLLLAGLEASGTLQVNMFC